MGILNKILNPITHSQDLNDEIEKYNKVINDYNKLCVKLQSDAINLYELRKETLKKVLQLDSYIEHLEDCPDCIIKSSKRAISFCHKLSNILPHSHNFCIVMSVDENYVTISFHMERKGETWLGDDLEVYKSDAILVMNVKNESNSK